MKAFLLAEGVGSRLRPLTDSIPKCLVPIQEEPLLAIWFELLKKYGITEVLVNAHAHRSAVAQFLRARFPNHHVTLAEEPELLGSAGTLAANREWVGAEASFWVLYGGAGRVRGFLPSCPLITMTWDRTRVLLPPLTGPSLVFGPRRDFPRTGPLDSIPQQPLADLARDILPRLVNWMFAYLITDYHLDIGTQVS